MERLQKYLSSCGIASRRKSEELILAGKVKVNGKVVTELGIKVSEKDEVEVENMEVYRKEKEYYLLYKPEKTICSVSDEKGRTTVVDLIETDEKIFPVGRLDYDTTGLLLLTNDGELTNKLTHPKGFVEKTYIAKVSGIVTGKEIHELEEGIELEGVKTKKARAKLKKIDKKNNKTYVELTITEGRNHQVKNMFAALGHKVLKLKRISYAFFDLKGMKIGEYRRLTSKEVKQLYNYVNIK
ncbi:MAG: pseudouridine synthase [Bacilli bacterium]|nr:pseudouridine synthase [Bacilli bacterium]